MYVMYVLYVDLLYTGCIAWITNSRGYLGTRQNCKASNVSML
jgi:hypothetical protein